MDKEFILHRALTALLIDPDVGRVRKMWAFLHVTVVSTYIGICVWAAPWEWESFLSSYHYVTAIFSRGTSSRSATGRTYYT